MNRKIYTITTVSLVFLFVYLVMLYLLEAIIFRIGSENMHILGFPRYFNILFIPFAGFILCASLYSISREANKDGRTFMLVITIIAVLTLVCGYIKMYHKLHFIPQQQLAKRVKQYMVEPAKPVNLIICVTNFPGFPYQTWMPLQYYFLPRKVKYLGNHLQLVA